MLCMEGTRGRNTIFSGDCVILILGLCALTTCSPITDVVLCVDGVQFVGRGETSIIGPRYS